MTEYFGPGAEPLFGLPLAELWFFLLFFLLGMFLFLDGFDFGVGAVFATIDSEEKETLLAAVGPFWDGNEVWLVVFGGSLFAAFPSVYANLFSRQYLLLFAILGALILRGLAPEFHEQRTDDAWQRAWGIAFVVGSVTAPFFLGMFAANWVLGLTTIVNVAGVAFGLTVVALTIVEGTTFLSLKTQGELRGAMARSAARVAPIYLLLVVIVIGYLSVTRPSLRRALWSPVGLGIVVVTILLVATVMYTAHTARYLLSFAAAGGLSFALVSFAANLLYPVIDPVGNLTINEAIVAPLPLNIMTVTAAVFIPLVLVYFAILYSVFSGPIDAEGLY